MCVCVLRRPGAWRGRLGSLKVKRRKGFGFQKKDEDEEEEEERSRVRVRVRVRVSGSSSAPSLCSSLVPVKYYLESSFRVVVLWDCTEISACACVLVCFGGVTEADSQ